VGNRNTAHLLSPRQGSPIRSIVAGLSIALLALGESQAAVFAGR
jgi:hypothetical protein